MSNIERDIILRTVTERVVDEQIQKCRESRDLTLEVVINDTLYHERERLKIERKGRETSRQKAYWSKVSREFHRVDARGREEILRSIVGMYVNEVVCDFDENIYRLAARVLPFGLAALLNRITPTSILTSLSSRLQLKNNLIITGPIDTIKELASRSTLIMTPTHVSNLDSIVIGLGLLLARLPPFTYGAGLNLFSNPILSFFMRNLGAYKVDRRKKNTLYKNVLKHYATLSMEQGRHNLFFPGGTRNRKGDVEQHLKLGLLGCGINAYIRNLRQDNPKPGIFIVPGTLSYGLVLEAKSLIDEHLKESGKSRFIDTKTAFSPPIRMLRFWKNLQSMDSKIHLHFGDPLDLFGNRVDKDGISRDPHGRAIDTRKYVEKNGNYEFDGQRDQEYTRELGAKILQSFLKDNTILSTHVTAFAAFQAMRNNHPQHDLYRFLRLEGRDSSVGKSEVTASMGRLLAILRDLESKGSLRLDPEILSAPVDVIFTTALAHFRSFHDGDVLLIEEEEIFTRDMKLLYYYRNRLDHYGLEKSGPVGNLD